MAIRCDVALVNMPYTFLSPSLALGLLAAELREEGIGCRVIYSSLRFITFLGNELYREAERLMRRLNMGWEVLFAPFAGFSPPLKQDDYLKTAASVNGDKKSLSNLRELWPLLSERTGKFLERETNFILSLKPQIVGCALLTQQRNASFALLSRIKERDAGIVTIIGGGCCAGERGLSYLRLVPALDYVFSGDADGAFKGVCRLIMAKDSENLCLRHPELLTRGSSPFVRVADNLDGCRYPDYSDFFSQLKEGGERPEAHYFILESSRGCWWGERSRCRFCGLSFSKKLLSYREKSAERFFKEAALLSERYGCHDIFLSDNVIGKNFIAQLPDDADEARKNLSLMAECRSGLSRREIKRLRANGFDALQPGIESLSDEMLALMNKGVKVIDHLSFLKSARIYGIHAVWNIIHTLPGERREWYEEMLALMRHLHHLEPPASINTMLLARDSVFYERAEEFGVKRIMPCDYDLAMNPDDADFIKNTAHYYQSPDLMPDHEMISRIHREVSEWRRDFLGGVHLIRVKFAGITAVRDARNPDDVRIYKWSGVKAAIMDETDEILSEKALCLRLGEKYDADEIYRALDELERLFLIYRKDGRLLSLATPKKCAAYRGRYHWKG